MVRILVALLSIFIVGCASAPTSSIVPGEEAVGARATLEVSALRQTAEAESYAEATAVSARSTVSASGVQTAVAVTATAEAQSTLAALAVVQTRQALDLEATAVAVTIEADRRPDEQRALNTIMLRNAEAARMERDQRWRDIFNALLAMLILAVAVAVAIIGASVASRVRALNAEPVRSFGDDETGARVLIVHDGLFGAAIQKMPQARIAAPSTPLLQAPRELRLQPITTGHVLIAGNSGAGKTVATDYLAGFRTGVTILDPHAAPDEWGDADVITGWNAIGSFMERMLGVLDERKAARNSGQKTFEPVTVVTDELPAIVDELGADFTREVWKKWLRQGRKFSLFLILSTQSTRVKTLGISGEGDLREQFNAVLRLGSVARKDYPELAADQERPAILTLEDEIPTPVTIPYVQPQDHYSAPPVAEEPEPVSGFETPYGHVPIEEAQQIMAAAEDGNSLRGITSAVYNATGGNGFYKVKWILAR